MYLTEWVQGSRYSVQSMWLKHSFPVKEPCVSWGCSLIWLLSRTEVPSKPPSAAAGGLRARSRLLAGGPLNSYHMGLSIGPLTTGQLTLLRAREWEGEQGGSQSLLWPTIGSDIPHWSLPTPTQDEGINTRALIPGSGETWGHLGGCLPHSETAFPHTCPPNPPSQKAPFWSPPLSHFSLYFLSTLNQS